MIILEDLLKTMVPNVNVSLILSGSRNIFLCTAPAGSEVLGCFKHMEVKRVELVVLKEKIGSVHIDSDILLYIQEKLN